MNDIKYENNNFKFAYRVSAIIYNSDKTKILLFTGNDSDYYMLPGGKVKESEKSIDAIKREITEEIGFDNLDFELSGISEEIIKSDKEQIQQITFIYRSIYINEIKEERFKSVETDWMDFVWININDINKYTIHPTNINKMLTNTKDIFHLVEEVNL
ncbi:MAG: NUDIX domain-containing protein [Clostridia bacterium]|nr:NUDIX domain-containing protein [Clostridia bacterium]